MSKSAKLLPAKSISKKIDNIKAYAKYIKAVAEENGNNPYITLEEAGVMAEIITLVDSEYSLGVQCLYYMVLELQSGASFAKAVQMASTSLNIDIVLDGQGKSNDKRSKSKSKNTSKNV